MTARQERAQICDDEKSLSQHQVLALFYTGRQLIGCGTLNVCEPLRDQVDLILGGIQVSNSLSHNLFDTDFILGTKVQANNLNKALLMIQVTMTLTLTGQGQMSKNCPKTKKLAIS